MGPPLPRTGETPQGHAESQNPHRLHLCRPLPFPGPGPAPRGSLPLRRVEGGAGELAHIGGRALFKKEDQGTVILWAIWSLPSLCHKVK